jgi:heme/copper-type cytochrome/quinol oxidase subunit 2
MGEQRATHPAATQHPATDKQAHQPALSALAFLYFVVIFLVALVLLVAALPQKMGEQRASDPATTQHPAGDQKAENSAMIFTLAFLIVVTLVIAFALPFSVETLAQEMSEQQAADTAAAQQAARDEELQESMLLVSALLVLVVESALASVLSAALLEQAREQQTSHASAPHHPAADHHFFEFQITHDHISHSQFDAFGGVRSVFCGFGGSVSASAAPTTS